MKSRHLIGLALCPLLLVASCFGAPPGPRRPAHLAAGDKQTVQGLAWYEKGCFQRALEHFLRAHELFTAADQTAGVAMSLNNLGTAYRAMGDAANAEAFFAEAEALYREAGDLAGQRQALANKAAALIAQNRLEEAGRVLAQAEGLAVGGKQALFVPLLNNQGVLLIKKKDFDGARIALDQAMAAVKGSGPLERATVCFSMGSLLLAQGRFAEARAFFEQSLDADRTAGFYKGIADDLDAMAQAYLGEDQAGRAVSCWKRAVQIYALLGLDQRAGEAGKKLKAAAGKTGADLSVAETFVDRWLGGKAMEPPCK